MQQQKSTKLPKKQLLTALLVLLAALFAITSFVSASALPNRYLRISNSQVNAINVRYTIGFTVPSNYTVGSVVFEVCQNSPFPGTPCTAPAGFTAAAASIFAQSGITGFSIDPSSTANRIIFTRTPSTEGPVPVRIELVNVVNPSTIGTFFGRLQTFTSTDGSGTAVDDGGVTFATTDNLSISTEVPPYLYFCVAQIIPGFDCAQASGNFVDMGEFSTTATKTGTSQFVVAENGQYGVYIYMNGTSPTSGSNVIPAMPVQASPSIGTSQFGVNLVSNTSPPVGSNPVGSGAVLIDSDYNTPNQFRFVNGDTIAYAVGTAAENKATVSYMVNINASQPPGIYNTTMIFTALASF